MALLGVAAAGLAVVVACASGGDDTATGSGDDGGGVGDDGSIGPGDDGGGGTKDGGGGGGDAWHCTPMGPPSTCASAMDLGTLSPGQMATASGNLASLTGEAYVSVTFSGNTLAAYHPLITMSSGATEFAFDVLTDCTGTVAVCDDFEAGVPANLSTWEEFYGDASDFANADAFIPVPPSGNDGGLLVHIYRRSGKPLSCNNYTLTVSE